MLMENEVFLSHPIIIDNPTLHLSLSSREEKSKEAKLHEGTLSRICNSRFRVDAGNISSLLGNAGVHL
jgi:hypothetical protein